MTTPNRPPLSPAAQAVMDAANAASSWGPDDCLNDAREIAAAALRAAADQVEHHWDGMECVDHLQAIAAELEGQQSTSSTHYSP